MSASVPLEYFAYAEGQGSPLEIRFAAPASFLAASTGERDKAGFLELQQTLVSPSQPTTNVRFYSSRISEEIAAGDVGEFDSLVRGSKIIGRREDEERSDFVAHLITAEDHHGKSWACRSKIIKDGSSIYRLDAAAPADSGDETARLCTNIAMSLELCDDPKTSLAEELTEHVLPGGSFRCPASWQQRSIEREAPLGSIKLVRDGFPEEQIHVDVFTVPGFEPITGMKEYSAHLQSRDLHVGGAGVFRTEVEPPFDSGFISCPSVEKGGHQLSTGCISLISEAAEKAVRIWCVGESRQEFPQWAITKRATKIIQATFSL